MKWWGMPGYQSRGKPVSHPAAGLHAGHAGAFITLSHEVVGHVGLLPRENAAVLNAALRPLARQLVPALRAAVEAAGLRGTPLYLTANDGTVISAAAAEAVRQGQLLGAMNQPTGWYCVGSLATSCSLLCVN